MWMSEFLGNGTDDLNINGFRQRRQFLKGVCRRPGLNLCLNGNQESPFWLICGRLCMKFNVEAYVISFRAMRDARCAKYSDAICE